MNARRQTTARGPRFGVLRRALAQDGGRHEAAHFAGWNMANVSGLAR
ncbi:hypothetical protein [Paraburkholderia sp. J67]|nr:hypothetical protein [Paraburkholderia sp. J67]